MIKDLEKKAKYTILARKIIVYTILIFFVFTVLFPLYVIVITSFKTKIEAMSATFSFWPEVFDVHGYVEVFSYKSGGDAISTVVRGFINTLWIVIPTSVIGTLMSSISAYSFAKIPFKGKNMLFAIILATIMMPDTITLVPSYVIFDTIGWVNTPYPLMVPGLMGGATCVFFMRQFYFSIPNDLIEAARIDGMGYLGAYFFIIFPLSIAAFIAQLILSFVGGYNAYLGPLLYLQSPELYTLQIALSFFQGTYSTDWAVVCAGAVCSLVPTIILYLVAQKYFISGIITSGMKL